MLEDGPAFVEALEGTDEDVAVWTEEELDSTTGAMAIPLVRVMTTLELVKDEDDKDEDDDDEDAGPEDWLDGDALALEVAAADASVLI